ncbi:hypothetical protein LC607_11915 [Nostoc sp. CHAB 5824]|nr:hypothetical protein [Nostoc sp. CHAB 5824]
MAIATTAAANVRNNGGRTAFNCYKTPACCSKFKVAGKSSKSVKLTLGGLSLLIGTCFDGAGIPFTKGYSLVSNHQGFRLSVYSYPNSPIER